MYWGNIETRTGRSAYPRIRDYMFAALIARTDIDFIALEKGDITARSVVDKMIEKMEQYANFGFDYIQEKLEDDPNHFSKIPPSLLYFNHSSIRKRKRLILILTILKNCKSFHSYGKV